MMCQRSLLGVKRQSPEIFTRKVTFKLLEKEDFQCLTKKTHSTKEENTKGKERGEQRLSIPDSDGMLINCTNSPLLTALLTHMLLCKLA